MKILTLNDELVLLAILKLGENAYIVKLREYLNENTDKKWSVGNVFILLEKLEEFGYVKWRMGEPTAKRGGKAIKFYSVSKAGIEALKAKKNMVDEMWHGLTDIIFDRT